LPTYFDSASPAPMLTPSQLRAARALVGWSREDLAKKSGVGAPTVKDFELNGSDPRQGTVHKWQRALEAAGVEFIDDGAHSYDGGPGVRLRGAKAKR
jgi:transcriptional regulator with XRE-family HTH domain